MLSKRVYITVFVFTSLLLIGCVVVRTFYPKIHYDAAWSISIKGRLSDATNGEPIGDAQVLYTLKDHPGRWPLPNTTQDVNWGASDILGVIDLQNTQFYSDTISRREEYKARQETRKGITFTITIAKEGNVSRRFDLDTAKLPNNEPGWAIADLGDIRMTRE